MARGVGGKTSVWVGRELAMQLAEWETKNLQTVNLSDLLAEAIRRKIGRETSSERLDDVVMQQGRELKAMQTELRKLGRELRALKKGAS